MQKIQIKTLCHAQEQFQIYTYHGGNGVRIDTAIYTGYKIPPTYDSMIAKIIVHGENRKESIAKMKSAVAEIVVDGITTNADFILKILDNENFKNNNYDTSFIKKEFGL